MKITYHEKTDLLYIRLVERPQEVTNPEIGDAVILDLGENDRIVGIEILDASKRLQLDQLAPVEYLKTAGSLCHRISARGHPGDRHSSYHRPRTSPMNLSTEE
jgi:uncharacterized protein YuzE